jgi:hypothetical protein
LPAQAAEVSDAAQAPAAGQALALAHLDVVVQGLLSEAEPVADPQAG